MTTGFAPRAVVAVLVIGVAGVLIPGLQPQLLGALAHEGRMSATELGIVATVELLAMGIAAGGAGFVLPVTRLRTIAAIALLVAALLDWLTPAVTGTSLIATRAAAGIPEGVLVWIAIGLIVRTAHPERWSGIYLMVQTLAQFAVASLLGLAIIPAAGSRGGFETLAAVTLLALAALPWLPAAYAPLAGEHATAGPPPRRGLVALAGVVLYLGFVVAVWVYVEPLGLRLGIAPATIAIVAPLSLAMQVLGAGLATIVAGRLPALPVITVVAAINLILLGVMATAASPVVFVAATAVFGLLWLFAMPFHIPLVVAADPSRRAAALIGGAQLIGASLGPFVASLLVSEQDVTPVLWFGAAALGLGVVTLALAARPTVVP